MTITQITAVGWTVLRKLDAGESCPFSLHELEQAINSGSVLELLEKLEDADGLIAYSAQSDREGLDRALTGAGEALSGRWRRKSGVEKNVLCHVMAMVLEAIQQAAPR